MEVRKLVILGAEMRAASDFSIVGKAVSYNKPSPDDSLGKGVREKIAPGCFRDSLANGDEVKALVNHNPERILGRTKNGTLTLTDGPDALRFRVQLDKNSQAHKDVHAAVARGDFSECSFAFGDVDDEFTPDTDSKGNRCQTRTVKRAKLYDVSIVTYPFYSADGATSAEARLKSNATALLDSHGLKEAILYLRKAAHLMGVQGPELRGDSGMTDFASRMDVAHRCAELACAISHRCYDEMPDDSDEIGSDDEVLRSAHEGTNQVLDVACERMAMVRLRHSKLKMQMKVLGRGKK